MSQGDWRNDSTSQILSLGSEYIATAMNRRIAYGGGTPGEAHHFTPRMIIKKT